MSFEIIAPPETDIWRKPPATNAFNAPTAKSSTGPLKSFQKAKITFSLPHTSELVRYDQGGILLSILRPGQSLENSQWIKTGIEFYLDNPWVGTVACDTWADWSIAPLPNVSGYPTVTLELERSGDELGTSLWIYKIQKGASLDRLPLREVTWLFADENDAEIVVSAYAARPGKKEGNEGEELVVKVREFEVSWKEEGGEAGSSTTAV